MCRASRRCDARRAEEKEKRMGRKVADCRDFPSESGCTLTISGEEDEVVLAATEHAVSVHGHEDTDEVRTWLRQNLKDEVPA
jgi:predicted small metal-binding protein